jgi:UTP--glucose-1-phosphate uridylyltransferase
VQVKKAVITAAGRGSRHRSTSDAAQKAMLPIVDRDGLAKPVLQIIAEEAMASGIEEVCIVSAPEDEAYYRLNFAAHVDTLLGGSKDAVWAEEQARRMTEFLRRVRFVVQDEPKGYGHAVWCARDYAAGEPVLLLLSDHVYISREARRCARQLLDLAESEDCAASAVQSTREHLIHQYGTIQGKRRHDRPDVYAIDEVVEKPNPTLAELRLLVPGLRAGHYLCFFGMHVLTPSVFEILGDLVRRDVRESGQIQLSMALDLLARREKYLALEARGARHNLGVKYGLVEAQIALALAGVDRDTMLSTLLETVVRIEQGESR